MPPEFKDFERVSFVGGVHVYWYKLVMMKQFLHHEFCRLFIFKASLTEL